MDSWLVSKMQAMQTSNLNIYNKYKAIQIVSPNPTTTATNLNANISVPLINSLFVKQGMGPNGTTNTMVSDIDSGLRTTATVNLPKLSSPTKPTQSRNQPSCCSPQSTPSSTTPRPAKTPSPCTTTSSTPLSQSTNSSPSSTSGSTSGWRSPCCRLCLEWCWGVVW